MAHLNATSGSALSNLLIYLVFSVNYFECACCVLGQGFGVSEHQETPIYRRFCQFPEYLLLEFRAKVYHYVSADHQLKCAENAVSRCKALGRCEVVVRKMDHFADPGHYLETVTRLRKIAIHNTEFCRFEATPGVDTQRGGLKAFFTDVGCENIRGPAFFFVVQNLVYQNSCRKGLFTAGASGAPHPQFAVAVLAGGVHDARQYFLSQDFENHRIPKKRASLDKNRVDQPVALCSITPQHAEVLLGAFDLQFCQSGIYASFHSRILVIAKVDLSLPAEFLRYLLEYGFQCFSFSVVESPVENRTISFFTLVICYR